MDLYVKRFSELSLDELYAILSLRAAVFVAEQNCAYQDPDGCDQEALHVWLASEDGIEAYLRVLDRGVKCDYVAIGRVIARKRRCGLGSLVLKEGIRAARGIFHADAIYVEAQTYARGLYEKQGFRQISDEFSEDGIPHIKMLLHAEE